MIDVSKIRIGDEVTVRMIVKELDKEDTCPIRASYKGGSGFWLYSSDIAAHTPKPREFKLGDQVVWESDDLGYEFVASANGWAFLQYSDGRSVCIRKLDELRHAGESKP